MFKETCIIATLATICLVSVDAGMGHKMKCLDKEVEMKEFFKGFMECAGTMIPAEDVAVLKDPKATKEEKKKIGMRAHKNNCIRVCQWKKYQKILNEDSTFNKSGADALVDKIFPEAARDPLKTGIAKCHADNSKDLKDDNQCESYKPMVDCMTTAYTEACKIDKKAFHMDDME